MRSSGVFLAGERLTYRIRKDLFRRFLRQPAAWFDDHHHDKATLTSLLAVSSGKVRDLVGDFNAILIMIVVSLGGGRAGDGSGRPPCC
jgi:hypothetical protein